MVMPIVLDQLYYVHSILLNLNLILLLVEFQLPFFFLVVLDYLLQHFLLDLVHPLMLLLYLLLHIVNFVVVLVLLVVVLLVVLVVVVLLVVIYLLLMLVVSQFCAKLHLRR